MYIVTGGLGFIGTHLVNSLLDDGEVVVVVDNLSAKESPLVRSAIRKTALIMDAAEMVGWNKKETCQGIFHLAADVSVTKSVVKPYETTKDTLMAGVAVLEYAARNGIRVVFPSSAAVYGSYSGVCREDTQTAPISPYGVSKLSLEMMARTIPNLSYCALRLFNVYGRGQFAGSPYSGVISKFVDNKNKNLPSMIYGDGSQRRDFIHVKDVVSVMRKAMQLAAPQSVFNVGTGVPVSIMELYSIVYGDAQATLRPVMEAPRVGDILISLASTEALNAAIGEYDFVTLRDGVINLTNY